MSLNNIFQFLVPKDKVFYPLFEQAASKIRILSQTLNEAVNAPAKEREKMLKEVEVLKQDIEAIAQKTRVELGRNFITPFDREDIHALISAVDDVADNLSDAASRMRLYQIDKVTKPLRKLTEANLEACNEVSRGLLGLNSMKNLPALAEVCKNISRLERKADKVFDKAVADIFENENDAIEIIKYKEIMTALETATDSCREVANILETITVKYS
jgi:predicted phosphate transport protein (TIGR00153 family)